MSDVEIVAISQLSTTVCISPPQGCRRFGSSDVGISIYSFRGGKTPVVVQDCAGPKAV